MDEIKTDQNAPAQPPANPLKWVYTLFWAAVGLALVLSIALPRIMPMKENRLEMILMGALLPILATVIYKLR